MSDDQIQDALDTIALLSAMYPLPTEFEMTSESEAFVAEPTGNVPEDLEMILRVNLDDYPEKILEIQITLPTSIGYARIAPRHPEWLSREEYSSLLPAVPEPEGSTSDYVLTTIDLLKQEASTLVSVQASSSTRSESPVESIEDLQRVWFWFPMLSTKEKRRDLVEYAPRYGLTGFVLAGKPALLCLEGDGRQVDRYMSAIKSKSWSDVPSFQKKVTERLRKPLSAPSDRKFTSMTDITHLIPTYGQYNHRGDMGEVKRLMEIWGVGEDFGAAVLNMTV